MITIEPLELGTETDHTPTYKFCMRRALYINIYKHGDNTKV